ACLEEDGLLVIGVPYLWGFKGLATKLTPDRLHVWFARRSNPYAGQPGHGPYPTFLRRDVSPRGLQRLAAEYRLSVVYAHTYRHSLKVENQLPWPLALIWRAAGSMLRGLT